MKLLFALVLFVATVAAASVWADAATTRCGWVDNPTPGNWSIVDREGEWVIGVQGDYQAEGELPDFQDDWVEDNGHHGYGCACMKATVDREAKRIVKYDNVRVLRIQKCKADKKLPQKGRKGKAYKHPGL